MSIEELINQVGNLSQSEKVELGQKCVVNIGRGLEALGMDSDAITATMVGYISLFVSADRLCSAEEYQLIKSIYDLDMSYEDFYKLSNGGANSDFIELMDSMADSMNDDLKMNICLFGLCILVSDNKLTQAEYDLFIKILQ